MSLFFTFLSICYIAGIFLWADSPIVEELSAFNPYSLLHIPLYGILTILLIFSKLPFNFFNPTNPSNSSNSTNPSNQSNELNKLNKSNLLISSLIGFIVAIADEIHQAYIPGRNASITDVLLDVVGIVLVVIVARRMRKKRIIGLLGN